MTWFLPILFFCNLAGDCSFKSFPAVSSQKYCQQVVEEIRLRVDPDKQQFKHLAIGCVPVIKSAEVSL